MSPYRLIRFIAMLIGFGVMLGIVGMGLYLANFKAALPDFDRMQFAGLRKAAQNHVATKLTNKKRQAAWVSLPEVSRDFLYALVASEDSTFFDHDGINFDALVQAFARNLEKKKYAYGGSTISQQVVKNVFLNREKTLSRKLKEFVITQDLEKSFSKNQILEVYFNIIEFGPDLFGVRAASQRFFKKSPKEINAAEAAFMAVMMPSPKRNYYSVFENQNLTKTKKRKIKRILWDMYHSELISQAQYERYMNYNYYAAEQAAEQVAAEGPPSTSNEDD